MPSIERQTQLKNWVAQCAPQLGLQPETMVPASADASFRSYWRLQGASGSYIVMDCPPQKESVTPFVRIDRLLDQAGLNVPKIYAEDCDQGFLLLSDLGRKSYLTALKDQDANRLMADAYGALVKLQKASRPGVLPDYSAELLMRELQLFPDWYVTKHLGLELSAADQQMLQTMFELIVKQNLSQAQVYVHRDYMPRNLMVTEENNPGVLDFQDAVYGPVSYDITCLMKDAFISWPEAQVLDWTIRYWEKARAEGIAVPADFGQFWTDCEWMGLQRHLKVLGIFARLAIRDGKPHYLKDEPRFLKYVNGVVHRFDALAPLAKFIDRLQNKQTVLGYTF